MSAEVKPARVLIIDDDPGIIRVYQAIFGYQPGFEPVFKLTPTTGLAYFEANRDTHLVLLDWDLPEMKGHDVASRIRQITGRVDDPIIFMLTGTDNLNQDLILASGVSELLPKPFSPKVLIERLTKANQKFQNPRA